MNGTAAWILLWVATAAIAAPPAAEAPQRVVPNEAAAPEAPQKWPGSHRSLQFLWIADDQANQIFDTDGAAVRSCRLVLHGRAHIGPQRQMILTRGWAEPEDVGKALLEACRASNELTIEAVVEPAKATQAGLAAIITFSDASGGCNFTLGQDGGKLVLILRTTKPDETAAPQPLTLCDLEAGRPQHVLVTFSDGQVVAYRDGKQVARHAPGGDLGAWKPMTLRFGDAPGGKADWAGRLEAVALYSRAVSAEEAARKNALVQKRLEGRQRIPRFDVEARLVSATALPDPKSVGNYRRALVIHAWDIVKVHAGGKLDGRVQIAHWAVMDGQWIDEARKLRQGQTARLTIEPMDRRHHPELVNERAFNDDVISVVDKYIEVSP